ncbi:MAG: formate dehydrogenase subunit alpha [Planctomycetes bacterium]|nr:formate dehydrogenase subunit alpha [Planctomycetota bacterium]
MDKIRFSIDGIEVTADKDQTILEAALAHDIYIPHLCYNPDVKSVGVCRLCMINIEGRGMTISCKTPVEDGMNVSTEGEDIDKVRRVTVELLLANHPKDCLVCGQNNLCELQKIAAYIGVDSKRLDRLRRTESTEPIDTSNPFFDRDLNKCVLCGICVRTCQEMQGVGAIDFAFRGFGAKISTFGDKPIEQSKCESCGECVVRCPVGALTPKNFQRPTREVTSICSYCGVGCGFHLGVRGEKIVSVRGDRNNPVNKGQLCVKGRFGYDFVNHPDRLTKPLIKKNGQFEEASWDEALELTAKKLSGYKSGEMAVFSSAKITNEENYVVQKFARKVLGTQHVDHCARLCHAPSVAGLAQSLGSGAMTNSINEIQHADCIFAIGTNTTCAHPVIALRIKEAIENGGKLIVANPKEIDLCQHAMLYLQHQPGTDVILMMGMMKVIVDEGLQNDEFIKSRCVNYDAFVESLKNFDLDFVEEATTAPREKIIEAARIYATSDKSSILYAMGITQHSHGTDNVLATSNLALLTGSIGRESTGVNPLRGQNNVQGACDMGALPNVYPGYQKVADAAAQKKFEQAWDCTLPDKPGLTHVEIFNAIDDGQIKALFIVGENPVISEADSKHVRESMDKADFIVVQDIFLTETAELADVVLPGATFAEKDGTFTNTERRVQRVRKAIEPVGDSKTDWEIIGLLARKMKQDGFDFECAEDIMKEIASLTPSYGGITYDRIKDVGLQWPCPTADHAGTKLLHSEKFATADGKGKFMPLEYKPSKELPDGAFPLILTTDRSLYHFHTSTMSRKVQGLDQLDGQELLDINPDDAAKLGIKHGEMVEVTSRRGKVTVKTYVTDICPPGVVSMTFHFAETPTNELTHAALDPVAKIPETKVCAVRVDKVAV